MTDRRNILLVANWESDIGYAWWLMENFWVTISHHFDGQHLACHLVYPKLTRVPETISSSNITVHECDSRDRSFGNLIRLRQIIRSNDIRYIYLSDYPVHSFFYVFLHACGIRQIVIHEHSPGERPRPPWIRRLIKRGIHFIPFYSANHFIAVTDYIYNRFLEVSCIPAQKCSVASNGITPIDRADAGNNYAQRSLSIPGDRLVIVTTGRADYYKGIDFFIECANEMINVRGHTGLHFLFCGSGPDLEAFKALADKLQINGHLTFAGKRADIRSILPSCDIGMHCAEGEVGYSLSILEYMSAGLATIVPDRPSTRCATRDNDTGLLYRPRDLQSACSAITRCMDKDFRHRLSEAAAEDIMANYDIENTNKQLTTILDRIFR